ncbi:MAG: paraquat-inducible protein A [Proteobacteria bacterium]|nr:paraquat-inducible protein A [Pseudomonadota bacterium]
MASDVSHSVALRDCPLCGLISTVPHNVRGVAASCPQCTSSLGRIWHPDMRIPRGWALAAGLFYLLALAGPFVQISIFGRLQRADIATGPLQLTVQGFDLVGFLVLAVTIIFPGIKLGIVLLTLFGIRLEHQPTRFLKAIFRWYPLIGPWAMVDVYLLGFLVAYTRLTAMATVHLDLSLFALVGLMISMAALDGSLDTGAIWDALDTGPAPRPIDADHRGGHLIGCHCCFLINRAEPGMACTRCDTVLRDRKPDSIVRSWAFVIAAMALYIPANLYPVMLITQLARTTPFTIMGGIVELFAAGLWPLGLLVLLASIAIPLVKLLSMACMLIEAQRPSGRHLLGLTRTYRFVAFIGRWSMIDVFMVSILVALVRFGQFANVRASTGAACFAGVVVITMFAVESFDPRLMWDGAREAAPETPHDPTLIAEPS